MNEPARPTKHQRGSKKKKFWDWFEVEEYMAAKFNFDIRDFSNHYAELHRNQTEVCEAAGHPYETWCRLAPAFMEPELRDWYQEVYLREQDRVRAEFPYQDFWGDVVCEAYDEFGNDSFLTIDWLYLRDDFCEEDWQKIICQWFIDEFTEEATEMYFWVSW